MADPAQNPSDNNPTSSPTPVDPAVDSAAGPPPIAPANAATTPSPVSSPSKEVGVPHFSDQAIGKSTPNYAEADKVAKAEGDEYWEQYAREIELEKEVAELGGIEKVESGEITLPEDVAREMGISPTVTVHTPMQAATGFSVGGTSLSDDQVTIGLKKPTSSGFRWLAEWFIYQLLKAHYHLKKVSGRIVRSKGVEK